MIGLNGHMVNTAFYYGFCFDANELVTRFQLSEEDEGETIAVADSMMNKVTGVTSVHTDFEFDSNLGEGEKLIVGIKLGSCDAHYTGVMRAQIVLEPEQADAFNRFIAQNPKLQDVIPGFYVYVDADK